LLEGHIKERWQNILFSKIYLNDVYGHICSRLCTLVHFRYRCV